MTTRHRFFFLSVAVGSLAIWLWTDRVQSLFAGELPKKTLAADLLSHLEKEGFVAVPLQRTKWQQVRVNVSVYGEKLDFIVDSGANRTFIDATKVQKIGLKWKMASFNVATEHGDRPAKLCGIDYLEIGSFKTKSLTLLDSGQIPTTLLGGDGLLGDDLLTAYQAIIDYSNHKLYLRSTTEKLIANPLKSVFESNGFVAVPIRHLNSGHIIVLARCRGEGLLLLVDTAATVSSLNQTRTKKLDLQWTTDEREERHRDGSQWAFCEIDGLEIGSVKTSRRKIWNESSDWNKIGAKSLDPPLDGLLGADILAAHDAIIDYPNRTLYLRKASVEPGAADKEKGESAPKREVVSKTGQVLLVNGCAEELVFRVNGVDHRVQPNMSKQLDNVPIGTVKYEVSSNRWGLLSRETQVLSSNERLKIIVDDP